MIDADSKPLVAWLVRLVEGVAVISACVVTVSALGPRTVVDESLPWLALILVVVSWMATGSRTESIALFGVPVLLGTSIGVGDTPLRLLGYGLTVCAVIVFTAGALIVARGLGRFRATGIAAASAAASLVGTPPGGMFAGFLILAGTIALGLAVFHDGHRNAVPLALVAIVGLTTPIDPLRAALFPAVLAAAVVVLRGASIRTVAIALVLGGVAGRWGLVIALAPLLAHAAARFVRWDRWRSLLPFPQFAGVHLGTLGRMVLVDPGAVGELLRARGVTVLSVGAIAVCAVIARPPLAVRFILAALVFIAASVPARDDNARSTTPVTFAALAVALLAWSGVAVATFPLPLDLVSVVFVAAIASAPLLVNRSPLSGAVAAALFLAGLTLAPGLATRAFPRDAHGGGLVGRGHYVVARPNSESRTVSIIAAGVNVADRDQGTILGWIEILDRDGRAGRRALRVRDLADWGAFREGIAFRTRNVVPARPAGGVEGHGRAAFIRGSGRIDVGIDRPIEGVSIIGGEALGERGGIDIERIGFSE